MSSSNGHVTNIDNPDDRVSRHLQPIKYQFMVAVLVEYIRSLNHVGLAVEVGLSPAIPPFTHRHARFECGTLVLNLRLAAVLILFYTTRHVDCIAALLVRIGDQPTRTAQSALPVASGICCACAGIETARSGSRAACG